MVRRQDDKADSSKILGQDFDVGFNFLKRVDIERKVWMKKSVAEVNSINRGRPAKINLF